MTPDEKKRWLKALIASDSAPTYAEFGQMNYYEREEYEQAKEQQRRALLAQHEQKLRALELIRGRIARLEGFTVGGILLTILLRYFF